MIINLQKLRTLRKANRVECPIPQKWVILNLLTNIVNLLRRMNKIARLVIANVGSTNFQ